MDDERWTWLNQPTRRRILLAAEREFAANGFAAARVDDIASRAEVSKSHLYYHFAGKDALLAGLVELRTAQILRAKARILDAAGDTAPEVVVETILREVLLDLRDFFRVVLAEMLHRAEPVRPALDAARAALADTRARLTAEGVQWQADWSGRLWHCCVLPGLLYVATDPHERLDLAVFAADLVAAQRRIVGAR